MTKNRPDWFVTYEEKPTCSRCGNSITGKVLRNWETDAPLCRQCAFALSGPRRRTRDTTGDKPVLTPQEIRQRNILIGCLGVALFLFAWRIYFLAPLFKPSQPMRHGSYQTDTLGDRCIRNLWGLSQALQQSGLPEVLPRCPASGIIYKVVKGEDDTVIRCPSPGSHGLKSLSVSYTDPVPRAISRETQ